jgi:tripartite-type tricarboxylate transporter receptor subunit TctC
MKRHTVCCLLLGMLPICSLAQEYPAKTVRVVVANAPGSWNDSVSRIVFSRVGEILGQQFIVDNRPGAAATSRPSWWPSRPPTATR